MNLGAERSVLGVVTCSASVGVPSEPHNGRQVGSQGVCVWHLVFLCFGECGIRGHCRRPVEGCMKRGVGVRARILGIRALKTDTLVCFCDIIVYKGLFFKTNE